MKSDKLAENPYPVKLYVGDFEKLRRLALEQDRSTPSLMRLAIREYLKRHESDDGGEAA